MSFQYHHILLPLTLVICVGITVVHYAFRHREAPAAATFAWVGSGFLLLCFSHAMEIAAVSLEDKALWTGLKHTIHAVIHPFWLILCLQLTQLEETKLGRTIKILLLIWMVINLSIVSTNDLHHWVWNIAPVSATKTGAFIPVLQPEFYYNISTLGLATVILVSVFLLFDHYLRTSRFFQRRALMMITACVIPMAGRFVQLVFGESLPFHYVDYEIFMAILACVLIFEVVFRFGGLDILPIAHKLAVKNIRAGIIVLDSLHRIVEMNPYARQFTALSELEFVGHHPASVFPAWIDADIEDFEPQEVELSADGRQLCFFAQTSRIHNEKGEIEGHVILFFDITDRKEAERQLELLATTDGLTGVKNRRHFYELAELEFARVVRYQRPLSVMMLDADFFKKINDTYGHAAGDEVLKFIAATCEKNLRTTDIFARYGGEEFICLLPETPPGAVQDTAERIRQVIETAKVDVDSQQISVTVSIGIAHFESGHEMTLDTLIQHADKALYLSKNNGRNQITVWEAEYENLATS